ncbi:nuclear transport factor 2 family protein [Nonomuraea sp. NPDC050783]|uniref:nuclear transport factor 2 family protein n=1 Tax=Nonomuraea sp. NPDC050783 TaxID=3154634 RepID=UPI0034667D1B
MIGRVAAAVYRRGLAALERGDIDALLANFRADCELIFISDTALGAHLSTRAGLRRWFERFGRLLPDPRFEIQRLVVAGPLWNQRLAAHVIIRSTVLGEPYQNQFAQFLTMRWGKVVEDLILEDTLTWHGASRRLVAAGHPEAGAGRLGEPGA